MKAILLVRVSDPKQREGYSLDAQLDRLNAYCQRNGFTVLRIFSFDESAFKGDRKNFHEVVQFVSELNEPVALCCDKLDRLTRNPFDLKELWDLSKTGKVELHFVSGSKNLTKHSTYDDETMILIESIFARQYSASVSANVKRAHERSFREGKRMNRAPFGYLNVTRLDGSAWVEPDEKIRPVLCELFEMYASSAYTLRQLQEYLQLQGYRKAISHIEYIIANPFYVGFLRNGDGDVSPHHYATIISPELWEACQRRPHQKYKLKATNFFLTGLIHCQCGHIASPYVAQKNGKVYLQCSNRIKCRGSHISEQKALDALRCVLSQIRVTEEHCRAFAARYTSDQAAIHEIKRKALNELKRELKSINEQRETLLDLLVERTIDSDTYKRRLDKLGEREIIIQRKLTHEGNDEQRINAEQIEDLLAVFRNAEAIFMTANTTHKREILRLLVGKAVLSPAGLQVHLKPGLESLFGSSSQQSPPCQGNKFGTLPDPGAMSENPNLAFACEKLIFESVTSIRELARSIDERAFSVAKGG